MSGLILQQSCQIFPLHTFLDFSFRISNIREKYLLNILKNYFGHRAHNFFTKLRSNEREDTKKNNMLERTATTSNVR